MNLKQKYQSIRAGLTNKMNPAQTLIRDEQGESQTTTIGRYSIVKAYQDLEVVGRGTNLLVDSCSTISIDVKDKLNSVGILEKAIKKSRLNALLNYHPNPYQTSEAFKSAMYIDLVLEGNAFCYFDGRFLYNLPAAQVEIVVSKTTFIKEFKYGEKKFSPDEIIWVKDNNAATIFRGSSRLQPAQHSITTLKNMLTYQYNLFENDAIVGLVISTPNVLSEKMKNRQIARWSQDYNPKTGGKKPLLLDGDFKLEKLGAETLRELEFAKSITAYEEAILKALGVPPILLNSGSNANISPNVRLFYTMTVLPLVEKSVRAFERYFGYDLEAVTTNVLALRPELKELSNYLSSLTNAGILTKNECREQLRMEEHSQDFADDLILPANIAGSAEDAGIGGRPPNTEE